MNESDERAIGRRGFLGALAGVSAAAAAGGAGAAAAQEADGDERTKARYQETPHVLKYYATNRY